MKLRILADMDGVLVDFDSGCARAHGTTKEEMNAKRTPGDWYLPNTLGCTLEEFWKPITEMGELFWLGLQPLPWARELLAILDSVTDDWHIVTAPSRCHSSYTGKVKWLKRYFGKDFDRFLITPHKHLCAKPGTLLIDDRAENCHKFRLAGGHALVFPSIGNELHRFKDNPLELLDRRIADINTRLIRHKELLNAY